MFTLSTDNWIMQNWEDGKRRREWKRHTDWDYHFQNNRKTTTIKNQGMCCSLPRFSWWMICKLIKVPNDLETERRSFKIFAEGETCWLAVPCGRCVQVPDMIIIGTVTRASPSADILKLLCPIPISFAIKKVYTVASVLFIPVLSVAFGHDVFKQ